MRKKLWRYLVAGFLLGLGVIATPLIAASLPEYSEI